MLEELIAKFDREISDLKSALLPNEIYYISKVKNLELLVGKLRAFQQQLNREHHRIGE